MGGRCLSGRLEETRRPQCVPADLVRQVADLGRRLHRPNRSPSQVHCGYPEHSARRECCAMLGGYAENGEGHPGDYHVAWKDCEEVEIPSRREFVARYTEYGRFAEAARRGENIPKATTKKQTSFPRRVVCSAFHMSFFYVHTVLYTHITLTCQTRVALPLMSS